MRKATAAIFLTIVLIQCFFPAAYSSESGFDHNRWTEYILFGNQAYKSYKGDKIRNQVELIEDALYLCIDQYNHHGTAELENLHQANIEDIPERITEIDFSSNNTHRSYTHRGWNHVYTQNELSFGHADTRKKLLVNVVKHVFSLEEKYSGKADKLSDAMACLLYNTHILGDRYHSEKYYGAAVMLLLADDSNGESVINDLIDCFQVLFQDAKTDPKFEQLISRLRLMSSEIIKARREKETNEGLMEIDREYSKKIKNLLAEYVPLLLQNEDWFTDVFPNKWKSN